MGLLDSVLGSVMGNLAGGRQGGGAGANILMQVLGGLLTQGGGVGGGVGGLGGGLGALLQQLQRGGLGDVAASWVGTGQNLPISPEQLQQGLGAGRFKQLAQTSGLTEGAAASALAGLLPTVIDRLTPDGAMPQAGQLQQLLVSVKTALGA